MVRRKGRGMRKGRARRKGRGMRKGRVRRTGRGEDGKGYEKG
jgi:hypothetical protein